MRRSPAIRALLTISVLGFTSFDLMLASLPSWAVAGGAGVGAAGVVTTALLLITVLVQLAVPAMVTRLGAGRVLALGLLFLGGPAPLYALSQDLGWLVGLSLIRGVGFAILTVVGTLLTFSMAPPGRHGESVGLYGLAIAVPNLLAVPAGVALLQAGLFPWAAVLAGVPVLGIPLALRMKPARVSSTGKPSLNGRRRAVTAVLSPATVLFATTVAAGGLLTVLPIERPSGQLATVAVLVLGATTALTRWRAGVLADRAPSIWWLPVSVALAALGVGALALGLLAGEAPTAGVIV
ncbi:MAG: MFS transporter [Mycobacteriaceae bacterium]